MLIMNKEDSRYKTLIFIISRPTCVFVDINLFQLMTKEEEEEEEERKKEKKEKKKHPMNNDQVIFSFS